MRDLSSINPLVLNEGPYAADSYDGPEALAALAHSPVLVIGAGGLGCEILKNLAMTGFRDISIIDMDTIDVSNLNRQFLFREEDVGRHKAVVAAQRVSERFTSSSLLRITPHVRHIQNMRPDFYAAFALVICGLDNIEARRWINATLVLLVGPSLKGLIPMIDGGTEGFRGQLRVILPTITLCFECTLDMVPPKTTFPVCTIANTPRLPEHCVEWARMLEWPRTHPDTAFDGDNPLHIDWAHAQAQDRARAHGITGVTRMLTLGVVKNIVPSIASTNAIIAASCCNEAFKIATGQWPLLNDYMMYSGDDSIFTYTFAPTKKPDCPVCGQVTHRVMAKRHWTLARFIRHLSERFLVAGSSFSTATTNLYFENPPALREATTPNLDRLLCDLVHDGQEVVVTGRALPLLRLLLVFEQ